MARAYAPGSLLFYFCQLYRASSCWYSCWYRQQSTKKITLHSNGYGGGRVSARGTKLRRCAATLGAANLRSSYAAANPSRHSLLAKPDDVAIISYSIVKEPRGYASAFPRQDLPEACWMERLRE